MSAEMHDLTYDVSYREDRNRVTTAFRLILAIPHLICVTLYGYAAELVSVLQWFVIVFTGQRNEGFWRFTRGYVSYAARANGYYGLLFDEYPGFFDSWSSEPVAFDLRTSEPPNRLTNALRFIWIIPAAIVGAVIGIGAAVVTVISWFAIVITGRQPRGLFDFGVRATRLNTRITAYGLLTTDDYPKWNGMEPTGALPPGDAMSHAQLPPPAYA